ncbi:MAG: GIY-YIG nuclease family protein [Ahrensia sp.]|nr:GIY-YIG nuclease family protein [Ahrensia sp.]
MKTFSLPHIFKDCGIDIAEDLKLYRHGNVGRCIEHHGRTYEDIYHAGEIDLFQAVQASRQLGHNLVAFFLPESGRLARFIGLRRVVGDYPWTHESATAEQSRAMGFLRSDGIWHDIRVDNRADELIDRLVIEWPEGRAHHRWLFKGGMVRDQFPVRELRAKGLSRPFPGFDDLILTFSELQSLVENDAAGWVEALRSTRGVYLITNKSSGDLYVGSATGADGLWGRWRNYVSTGHGGNRVMMERLEHGDLNRKDFQFSILQTLGSLAAKDEGLAAELRWKTKLGRRAITLNGN